MQKQLLLLAFFIFQIGFSQNRIVVKESETEKPLANATVSCNGKNIGHTDVNGQLKFSTKCKSVNVSLKGYYDEDAMVEKNMEIFLSKEEARLQGIKTIVLEDKSDPKALELLNKVNEHYKNNAPNSLDSYEYKSYEKISLDFDLDSIGIYKSYMERKLDSLKKVPVKEQTKKEKKDSLENVKLMKLFGESKLFLWERVSEFLYSKKYGEKIKILDNKVSGFQQPIYEMMTLRSNRNRVPRQIQEENRTLYRFFLTDSTEIDHRKTYVIKFRQTEDTQARKRRKFNGFLYIDAETYGLRKIVSNSRKKTEGNMVSEWILFDGKWFLNKEFIKFKIGSTNFKEEKTEDSHHENDKNEDEKTKKIKKKFGNYIYMKADYFDYKSPSDAQRKDFRGYTMDVVNSDGKILEKYRTDSLSERDKMTYIKIDSVGKKYRLDQKARLLAGALRGDLRLGMINLDMTSLFNYNAYEKFRLGAAIKFNEKFNKYISPDVYVAYGFGDHAWKFGAGVDFKTTLQKNSFFRVAYFDDVKAAGRFNEDQWSFRMKLMNSGVDLNNGNFYHFKGFKVAYENDITNGITVNVSANRTSERAVFDYLYDGIGNQFQNFSTKFTLKFSPNSKNIMTPTGKYTYDSEYPEVYFNYEQGLKTLGGALNFSRFDVLFINRFKTDLGITGMRLSAGLLNGDTPIWHHFMMNGLSNDQHKLNFNLTTYLGFATMQGGKYYNDRFVDLYFHPSYSMVFQNHRK